jgi:hypothetical protein
MTKIVKRKKSRAKEGFLPKGEVSSKKITSKMIRHLSKI